MKFVQRLFLFVSIFGIAGILFFEQALSARLLESGFFESVIPRDEAEDFIADQFGGVAQYSWYGSRGFRPAIYVMLEKDGVQRKIILNAFSGEVFDAPFDVTKNQNFSEFTAAKLAEEEQQEKERILQEKAAEAEKLAEEQEKWRIAEEKAKKEEEEKKREELTAQKIPEDEEQISLEKSDPEEESYQELPVSDSSKKQESIRTKAS